MQLLDQFNPQIKVSGKEFPELLLGNFHMVVLSEPDPETWMANLDEGDEFYDLLEFHSNLIVEELYGEMEMPEEGWKAADDVEETMLVAVGEGVEMPLYYHYAVSYAHAVFEEGFDTTIVTRYCISSHSLIDLDELFASMTEEQHRKIIEERWVHFDDEKKDED